MAEIIYADFKSKTFHKPQTLEQLAVAILDQVDTSPSEMPPVRAEPEDCA